MNSEANISPLKAVRREKILDTALQLFTRNGFKSTTMEGIAAAVGMSKVTVYAYFGDKDALFEAVAERFMKQLEHAVEEAISGEGELRDRIANAMIAKYQACRGSLASSTLARELSCAGGEVVRSLELAMRKNVEATLAKAMRDAGMSSRDASARARLLSAASHGIGDYVTDQKQAVADIQALVASVI